MAVKAVDLRKGMGVKWEGNPCVVHSTQHVAKGNKRSYMQVELRNIKTGQILPNRFRVDEMLEEAFLEHKPFEFLYAAGDKHVLMDGESFEQLEIPAEIIGERAVFLTPNLPVEVSFVEGVAVLADLPNTVELKIVDTPPEVKGATAQAQLKEAVCEGGARIRVPAFIGTGEVVKVDTRTGEYLGRA
jgi:elongation factor P